MILRVVHHQIVFGNLNRRAAALPVKRILERFVHVQIRDGIAVFVRLRFLVHCLPRTAEFGFVAAHFMKGKILKRSCTLEREQLETTSVP